MAQTRCFSCQYVNQQCQSIHGNRKKTENYKADQRRYQAEAATADLRCMPNAVKECEFCVNKADIRPC